MLNFCLYKPCAMCLSLLHFQPCAGNDPDCNCCLSNKYTYMQLRSPEVTSVNFHLPTGLSTLRTMIWLFSSMDPLVDCKFIATPETLPTCSTLIWLFPSVDHQVCLEMRHSTKRLSTLRTMIWLFTCMCHLVCLEMRHLTK